MCRITVISSLFNCQQYLNGYFEAIGKIKYTEQLEILLLHNAPKEGELKIIREQLPKYSFVKHVIVEEREGLYATWNRGISMAKGNYITTWNVDDIRLPNSLNDQANSLDQHRDAAIAYGNFMIVDTYGSTQGKNMLEPEKLEAQWGS